jgi:hypothetical protein
MKKYRHFFTSIALLLLLVFTCLLNLSRAAYSADFIIGAKAGYFIWDPYLKRSGSDVFSSMKNGDGVLYGPILSVSASDFSLSFSGLFGRQSALWKQNGTKSATIKNTGEYVFDTSRMDLDGALSYRLLEYLRVIAGYKYQKNRINFSDARYSYYTSTNYVEGGRYENTEINLNYNGPAVGIGFSIPFAEKFFVAANASFVYLWGSMKLKNSGSESTIGGYYPYDGSKSTTIDVRSRGINFEPTIGASMGEGLPVFTLGLKTQLMQNKFVNPDPGMGVNKNWNNDYLYGVFVSVLYPF